MKLRAKITIGIVAVVVVVWFTVIGVAADSLNCWSLGTSTPSLTPTTQSNAPNDPNEIFPAWQRAYGKYIRIPHKIDSNQPNQ